MQWDEMSLAVAFKMMSEGYVLATSIDAYQYSSETGRPYASDVEILREGGYQEDGYVEVGGYLFPRYSEGVSY